MFKKSKFLYFFISIIIQVFILTSCQPKEPYLEVADNFVLNYYKVMNQEEAIKFTAQNAKEKLEKELQLVREARAKNPQLDANRANVSYRLEEAKIEKNVGMLSYRLTIQPKGAKAFERSALLTLINEKNEWKVVNYEELNVQ